MNRRNQSTKEM